MSDRVLIAKTNGALVFTEVGDLDFEGEINGSNLPEAARADVTRLVTLNSGGLPKKVPLPNEIKTLSLFVSGEPIQTAEGSYYFKIPMTQFGSTATILGIAINASVWTGLTGSTTIRAGDAVYGSGNVIDVVLTNTGADTDRNRYATGSFVVDTATENLYVHVHGVGGHANINVTIFFKPA